MWQQGLARSTSCGAWLRDLLQQQQHGLWPILLAVLLLGAIPYLQIGIIYLKFWVPNKKVINPKSCACPCFDTVFRGAFEDPPSGYKHVYFNATKSSFCIYLMLVINVIVWYKAVEHVYQVWRQGQLRRSMCLLLVVNIYPNYYSWWSFFIYLNESMYQYFVHHLFFYLTELMVTALSLHLVSKQVPIEFGVVNGLVSISVIHVLVGGLDQFVDNVLLGGTPHTSQVYRDVALLLPDLAHIVVPLWLLSHTAGAADSSRSPVHLYLEWRRTVPTLLTIALVTVVTRSI